MRKPLISSLHSYITILKLRGYSLGCIVAWKNTFDTRTLLKRCRASKEMLSTYRKHEPLTLSGADYVVFKIQQENESYSDQERDGRKIAITLAAVRESKISLSPAVYKWMMCSLFSRHRPFFLLYNILTLILASFCSLWEMFRKWVVRLQCFALPATAFINITARH